MSEMFSLFSFFSMVVFPALSSPLGADIQQHGTTFPCEQTHRKRTLISLDLALFLRTMVKRPTDHYCYSFVHVHLPMTGYSVDVVIISHSDILYSCSFTGVCLRLKTRPTRRDIVRQYPLFEDKYEINKKYARWPDHYVSLP